MSNIGLERQQTWECINEKLSGTPEIHRSVVFLTVTEQVVAFLHWF